MSTASKFASHSEAHRAGWFSRRHQTNEAHREQQATNEVNKTLQITDGEERNKAWKAKPLAEKIASLKARRGQSRRQLTKLLDSKGKK